MLVLRTYPIAIKMLKSESEIPEGSVRPKKDLGEHYSTCQAFGIVRHRGTKLAMFIEDHWCFEPIIGYGLTLLAWGGLALRRGVTTRAGDARTRARCTSCMVRC